MCTFYCLCFVCCWFFFPGCVHVQILVYSRRALQKETLDCTVGTPKSALKIGNYSLFLSGESLANLYLVVLKFQIFW